MAPVLEVDTAGFPVFASSFGEAGL